MLLHESQGQRQINLKSSLLAQFQLERRLFSSATENSTNETNEDLEVLQRHFIRDHKISVLF